MLEYWRKEYLSFTMRIFNDVVHNQFRHLNGPGPTE
jgi:hypothetical protein